MNTSLTSLVEEAVLERMQARGSFTGLDVSNALKTQKYAVTHRDVAAVVREIYRSGAMGFYDYDRSLIDVDVDAGRKKAQAFLYRPAEVKAREYTSRSQSALPTVPRDQARHLPEGTVPQLRVPDLPRPTRTKTTARRHVRRDGALAIPKRLLCLLGWQTGCALRLKTTPGEIVIEAASIGEARIWNGPRLRLCRRRIEKANLTADGTTCLVEGGRLRVVAERTP